MVASVRKTVKFHEAKNLVPAQPEKGDALEIYTKGVDLKETIFLVPSGDGEGEILQGFARPDEPLVVVLRKDPSYKHPHIEIRKETT